MFSGYKKKKIKQFLLIQFGLALLAVIACVLVPTPIAVPASTDTPTSTEAASGPTCPPSVQLPEPAEIFLRSDSKIVVIKVSDATVGQSADTVELSRGEIVVKSVLPPEKWVEVLSPNGFIARLAGSTMIVAYEDGAQFTVACVDGSCKVGPDDQHLTDLAVNSQASLDKDGNFPGPVAITLEDLPASCETIIDTYVPPTETPTSTVAPTLAVDTAATATAACKEFHSQFPLTPTCP